MSGPVHTSTVIDGCMRRVCFPERGSGGRMKSLWGRHLRKVAAKMLDLPADVTMEMPRITMIGQIHLYIENHRGVLQFTNKELRLLLTKGQLIVRGERLVIRAILPEEVLIEGKISGVQYIE
jgi:sporulation protein YqfC